jgi:exonuclease 3'-5' domain-containing protein 1
MDKIKHCVIETREDYEKHFAAIVENPPAVIYFDAEGNKLSKAGELCVLQIAVDVEDSVVVYIFDAIACKEPIKLLKPLFENEKVLKVIHDTKRDAEALFWQYDIKIVNVFDTQIAYHELQKTLNKPLSSLISFVSVLENCCKIDYSKKNQLPHVEFQDATAWLVRPLDKILLEHAIQDVFYLKPIYMYFEKHLNEKLKNVVINYSTLWSRAYFDHKDLKLSASRTTHLDIQNSGYILRIIHLPCNEVMGVVIGKKGVNFIELLEKFGKRSYIFTAGREGPRDMLYIMAEKVEILDEFIKEIPEYCYESFVTRYQSSKIICIIGQLSKDTKTKCMIFTAEVATDSNGEQYHKMVIIGSEKNVQEAIRVINDL